MDKKFHKLSCPFERGVGDCSCEKQDAHDLIDELYADRFAIRSLIARKDEAIVKYGVHKKGCNIMKLAFEAAEAGFDESEIKECSCGLKNALALTSSNAGEAIPKEVVEVLVNKLESIKDHARLPIKYPAHDMVAIRKLANEALAAIRGV